MLAMARIARVVIPGVPVHVVQRGNHQADVFHTARDHQIFLEILEQSCDEHGVNVIGFCLVTNHYQVICVPERVNSLALALGRTNQDYSRWHNIQQRQTGYLWQGRYRSCPLDEGHLWNALCYVERNPVAAGLVKHAWQWLWSSAAEHCAAGRPLLSLDTDLWRQRYTEAIWRDALERGVSDAAFAQRLREATGRGRPLGPAEFVEMIERGTGRVLRPQKPGRKPNSKIHAHRRNSGHSFHSFRGRATR
jgi:putative transposase